MQIFFRCYNFILACLMILLTGLPASGQDWLQEIARGSKAEKNFHQIVKEAEDHFIHQKKEYFARDFRIDDNPELHYEGIRDYIGFKRWEEYWQNHVDEKGNPLSPLTEYREFKKFLDQERKATEAAWVNINRTSAPGGYWGMGRIREIAFHPTDPNTFWAGADQGGIWLSRDNGLSYTAIADDLPYLKVSSICVDHSNPDILYMSAGGTDGGWWDRTIGVYKTINGGDSWEPTALNAHLSDYESYRRLAISPDNSLVLLVTGREGIYRTSDGGDSWIKVASGDFYDLLFDPENGSTVFAGKQGEIYKSTDAGLSWRQVSRTGYSGYMRQLTVSPVDSRYMAAELDTWISDVRYSVILTSRDGGENWQEQSQVNDDVRGTIAFSSYDTTTLYRGWTKIFRSGDFGKSWVQKTMWYQNGVHDVVHADHFRIKKNPLKDSLLYFCNDGGVYIYNENTDTWTERTAGLIISQYYCVSSSQSDPSVLLSGSQDNGGWYRTSSGEWRTTNGGDGMHTWQHPEKVNIGYSSYPGGKLYKSTNAWLNYHNISNKIVPEQEDGDWNSRYAIDPNNYNVIVTGCFPDIYRSVNMGTSWERLTNNLTGGDNLHCITIPESDSDYIYASAGKRLFRTMDAGKTWRSFTPANDRIKGITVSPYNADHLWIVTGGYTEGEKVFTSTDGGSSWENISANLPNLPALSVIYQKGTNDGIYVGMTYGVYYRNASMDDWVFYGHGIPNCEIRHLDIQYPEGKIRCATYGRGIYEADLYPLDISPPLARFTPSSSDVCLGDTIRFINESENYNKMLWNFGDGNKTTITPSWYVYEDEGSYDISLTVFNDQLASTQIFKDVNINSWLDAISAGPSDPSIGSKAVYRNDDGGIIFNTHYPLVIKSFVCYSASAGDRNIQLLDKDGKIIESSIVNLEAGENTVFLDMDVDPGNDYTLKFNGKTDLVMNTDGASFPYGKNDLFSITGNTSMKQNQYYFFYDINIQYKSCNTEELPAVTEDKNIALGRLLVYPNPVKDIFNIEIRGFEQDEELFLRISSLEGKILLIKDISLVRNIRISVNELGTSDKVIIIEAIGKESSYSTRVMLLKDS